MLNNSKANIITFFHPLVQHKLIQVGGDYQLLVTQLTSLFNIHTVLLEYLSLEGTRLSKLLSKSEETPDS